MFTDFSDICLLSFFQTNWPVYLIAFKVHLAQQRNASGVILFSDPADFTSGDLTDVYPHDWWLPPSGTQRGTLMTGDGDPLSADYPALSMSHAIITHNRLNYVKTI